MKHPPFMLLGIVILLVGLWAGLTRIGWPFPGLSLAMVHGPLMVSGFLGTLIGMERAVAFGRGWAFAAPLLASVGALLAAFGVPAPVPAFLMVLASIVLVGVHAGFVVRQQSASMVVMGVGAVLWWMGNTVWLSGQPVFEAVHWWMGFVALTILGERYGLSRMMAPSPVSRGAFYSANALVLVGLATTLLAPGTGTRVLGAGLIVALVWILRYDIGRRTIRQPGLTRFVAVSLAAGGVWLGVAGVLLIVFGAVPAGPHYDAIVHAVFVGFVFSMIFGHAPVVLPFVMKVPVSFTPFLYAPLVLLHVSLLLRVIADLMISTHGRQWSGLLNSVAILLFFVAIASSAIRSARQPAKPA
jgi:hypothetical protein